VPSVDVIHKSLRNSGLAFERLARAKKRVVNVFFSPLLIVIARNNMIPFLGVLPAGDVLFDNAEGQ
jgi:hypothetical protein